MLDMEFIETCYPLLLLVLIVCTSLISTTKGLKYSMIDVGLHHFPCVCDDK